MLATLTLTKLVALVYQTSAENGQVDPLVVQKAVGLIGN